jgi:hypothetical protein
MFVSSKVRPTHHNCMSTQYWVKSLHNNNNFYFVRRSYSSSRYLVISLTKICQIHRKMMLLSVKQDLWQILWIQTQIGQIMRQFHASTRSKFQFILNRFSSMSLFSFLDRRLCELSSKLSLFVVVLLVFVIAFVLSPSRYTQPFFIQ